MWSLPKAYVFPGIRKDDGAEGCLASHKAIVKMAMQKAWSSVWIIEDDCEFTDNFNYKEWCYIADQMGSQVGVLVGGVTRVWGQNKVRKDLVLVEKYCSSHCVLYHSSSYDRVLNAIAPVDQGVGPALVVLPFVAIQSPSYSAIEKRYVDYGPLYKKCEDELTNLQ